MKRLMTAFVVLLALLGVANAAGVQTFRNGGVWGVDTVGGVLGVFSSGYISRGPGMSWMLNTSATDTLTAGEPVGTDPDRVAVVDTVAPGLGTKTLTIADSLTSGSLDTLLQVPRVSPSAPNYDTARLGVWRIHLEGRLNSGVVTARTVSVTCYDYAGNLHTLTFSDTIDFDTILATYDICKVTAASIVTKHAQDSIWILAEPISGVKVGTSLETSNDSAGYIGVAQTTILPRRRGPVQQSGPGLVKIDATTTDIKNGYWVAPSSSAGFGVASATRPDKVVMGRVLSYSQANGVASVMLWPPQYLVAGTAYDSATVAALAYGFTGAEGGLITNPHADTLKLTEDNIVLNGKAIPNSLYFPTGASTITNPSADTLKLTETYIVAAGGFFPNSIAFAASGGTITAPATDTLKMTETNIALAGVVVPSSVTFPNGTTMVNGHADTLTVTETNIKAAGILIPNSITLANGTTIDDVHADTTTVTETNIKLAGVVIPNSLTLPNGATVVNGHADTVTITEANVKAAGILIPNSITLANGTTIDDVHADTTTITETNIKLAGDVILPNGATVKSIHADTLQLTEVNVKANGILVPNSIAFANGTTIDDVHADTTTITETNIKLAGVVIPTSVTMSNGATITAPHADTLKLTETNVAVAGVLNPTSITMSNAATVTAPHADTLKLTETNIALAGVVVPTSVTFPVSGATITDPHADTVKVTEANIRLAGAVLPTSVKFPVSGATITDPHADTVKITETNIALAGVVVPNSITLPNGSTIVNGHADTLTLTEAKVKIAGDEVVTGSVTAANSYSTTTDSSGSSKAVTAVFSTSVVVAGASATANINVATTKGIQGGLFVVRDTFMVRAGGGAAFAASSSFGRYDDSIESGVDSLNLAALNFAGAQVTVFNWGVAATDTLFVKNGGTVVKAIEGAGHGGHFTYIPDVAGARWVVDWLKEP